jgi:tetratricopeptide (TPR) repeat protein
MGMRRLFIAVGLVLVGMQGGQAPSEKFSPQEAYFLRRMTEFWKDRDYRLVKSQIEEFLKTNPASGIHEPLHAILADILYHEHAYTNALAIYQKITDPSLIQKTRLRKCQCLYLTGAYDEVIKELSGVKDEAVDEMKFVLADSLFRKMQGLSEGQKSALAQQAKPLLIALYETSYRPKVIYPLAEVRRVLGDNAEAATLFLQLADQMPEKKEEILLQAAALQMAFNKGDAICTYQRVVDLGQSKAPDAAYNELVLLFHEDRHGDLVAREKILASQVRDDKKALFNFCLGRSHFKLEHFAEAITYFEQFIQEEKENTPYKRAAILTLITCAQKVQNTPLFDQTVERFVTTFPHDIEAGKALLLRAQAYLKEEKIEQAAADLGRLLSQFPDFPEKETLVYNHALLLLKCHKWEESRKSFLAFVSQFPTSPQITSVWPSILQCSTEELKTALPDEILHKKGQLASDLQRGLGKCTTWSEEEKAGYQFLLGQLLYDTKDYPASLATLDYFVKSYPQHTNVSQALLMQAYLHRALASPPDVFVKVAEEALQAAQAPDNKTALRLQLFNSYLTLKNYDKAAEHLYHAVMVDNVAVNEENMLWLAHHFSTAQDKRAFELLQRILKYDENFSLHFDPEKTYLEAEVMKLADLIPLADRKKLFLSLREVQNRHPNPSWKLQRQVSFELAKIQLSQGETEAALNIFEELSASAELTPSYYSHAAILEKNRILISRCAECDRTDANPIISHILSTLKDLQIQKKLACEPLHLEAALEYADLRTTLVAPESRVETALFFLQRIQEDFTTQDDTIRQEYHQARLRFPEKDTLFQTYMKCIQAEILALQAQMAQDPEGSLQATALFEDLLKEGHATLFLKQRAESYLSKLHR